MGEGTCLPQFVEIPTSKKYRSIDYMLIFKSTKIDNECKCQLGKTAVEWNENKLQEAPSRCDGTYSNRRDAQ
jgi:hypothetical protein